MRVRIFHSGVFTVLLLSVLGGRPGFACTDILSPGDRVCDPWRLVQQCLTAQNWLSVAGALGNMNLDGSLANVIGGLSNPDSIVSTLLRTHVPLPFSIEEFTLPLPKDALLSAKDALLRQGWSSVTSSLAQAKSAPSLPDHVRDRVSLEGQTHMSDMVLPQADHVARVGALARGFDPFSAMNEHERFSAAANRDVFALIVSLLAELEDEEKEMQRLTETMEQMRTMTEGLFAQYKSGKGG